MDSKTKSEENDVTVEEVNTRVENIDTNVDANDKIEEESSKKDKGTLSEVVVKEEKEAVPSPSSLPPPVRIPNVVSQCAKDEYLVKTIDWKNKKIRIITQNENGPCPLVAICNVLFLRGDLEIRPPDREVVTFEYLVDRLGDYLLNHEPVDEEAGQAAAPTLSSSSTTAKPPHKLEKRQETTEFVLTYRHNLDTALSILPNLKSGLDVNVKFDSIRGFEPTAELAMFDLFNVDLVHGWIADPQDIETYDVIVKKCGTYNHTVEKIVQADELSTRPSEEGLMVKSLTLADEEKLHQGFVATEFLKDTATQLTYYGLDLLLDSIPLDTLCVLFRNNHFCTLYRQPTSGLYMLVTDSGLVLERSIIWESLADIDQGSSEFYNGNFMKPQIQENVIIPDEDPNTDLDYAIAVSMQDEQNRQQQKRNSYHNNQQQQSSNTTQALAPNKVKYSSSPATTTVKKSDNSKCFIS